MKTINLWLRPKHPWGPNVRPCGDPGCFFCRSLEMEEGSRLQLALEDLAAARRENTRLRQALEAAKLALQIESKKNEALRHRLSLYSSDKLG